jgi:tetratricopeptide (TPR) repeat protein
MSRGNYERARDLVEQTEEDFREAEDKYGMDVHILREARRITRQLLGEIELALGNTEKAANYYEEALAIARKLGNKRAVV